MSSSIDSEILDIVRRYTNRDVSNDSEIYLELGIYGDYLGDLIDDITEKFGCSFLEIDFSSIAPGEGGGDIAWVLRKFGLQQFPSFKVSDLIAVVKRAV